MKRKALRVIFTIIITLIIPDHPVRAEKMLEVKIDIGNNIDATARASGAPRWGAESHWGLKIYELVNIRSDVVVTFSRENFEIRANPLFSMTMYADSENHNDLAVTRAEFQYAYKAKNHLAAQEFVEKIIAQFRKGKWKRHIAPTCPSVSGRSNFLDETGKVSNSNTLCALDPAYRLTQEEWIHLMRIGKLYEWSGDNILATLSIDFYQDAQEPNYNIGIEFQDFSIKTKHDAAEQKRILIDGDKKGWNSTENYKKGMEEEKVKMKVLEANAVRRGDHLVSRD